MNNVDTHNLLISKENIQPLRQGRDTSKLCAALEAQSNKEMQQLLEKQRNEFEIRLRSNIGDDPLSDWCDYIHWIEQSFLKKPHEGKLNTILQKCLNKFKDNERYKNDVRFVKLCIKYADMEENTVELLSQIHRHGIGLACSELYIAWAEKHAINNCFKKANMVYEKGLQNQAKPLELLKQAHQNFHAFLVRRMLNEKEEFKPTFLGDDLNKEVRQPYNVLQTINSSQNDVVSNVRIGANVKGSPGKLKMNNMLEKKPKSNICIKIFEDNAESVAVEPPVRLQKIHNKKILSKENTIKPGPWTNSDTKKIPFTTSLSSNVPFQVHRDEEEYEAIGRPSSVSSSVLKSRNKRDNDAPALTSRQLFYPEPYDPTKIVMYCKDQVYAGGLEFQFEELRAIEYRRKELERDNVENIVQNVDVQTSREPTDTDLLNIKSTETNKKTDSQYLWGPEKNNSDPLEVNVFCEQKTELPAIDRNKADRRKTFVLEPIHKDRVGKNKCVTEEVLPTTEYSINQTIHTKEALSEMQQLWFSKPASPLLEDNAGSKHTEKSILKPARPCFNLYIDESCIQNFINTDEPEGPLDLTFKCGKDSELPVHQSADKLKKLTHDPKLKERNLRPNQQSPEPLSEIDDANKENNVPENYCGSIGKSTRKVSGILTPAENIPVAPLSDEGNEDDEEEEEQVLGVPQCNITGVTENLTKVFQFPRNESTPNPRKSQQYKQDCNKSLFEGELNGNQKLEFESKPIEVHEINNKLNVPADNDLASKKSPSGRENCLKNLSMIAETSREYKSSSSGSSGVSTFQIRSLKNHPRYSIDVRATSSNMTVSQSLLHKTKMQSLTGYEASSENTQTGLKSNVSADEKLANIEDESALNIHKSQQQQKNDREEVEGNLKASEPIGTCLKDIDPFSDNVIDALLKSVKFCGDKYPNYVNENSILNMPKVGGTMTLGNLTYDIKKILGEGSYARVYDLMHLTTGKHVVAKMQKPAFPWEFYIIEQLHLRIKDIEKAESFMRVESAHFFRNASVLLTKPVEFGNLLNTINILKQNQLLNHLIAVYFTIEMLRILDTLHSCQIIHADIKPDNFLVMNRNDKPRLQLIDFGRAIDMTLLPKGTTFTQVIKTEGFTTTEMKKGKPWTYQVDFYGAANSSHCLLFGDYMKVTEKNGIWNITKIIPRYWARNEWKNYFSTLLNIKSCLSLPDIHTLINSFEAILKDNKEFDFILNRLNSILRNQ